MVEFVETNPQFNPGLLSFTLEYLLANKWPSNSLMGDYNTCDEDCDIGQTEPCGCTCNTNPFEWTDDEVCLTAFSVGCVDGWEGAPVDFSFCSLWPWQCSRPGGEDGKVACFFCLAAMLLSLRRPKPGFERFSAFGDGSAYDTRFDLSIWFASLQVYDFMKPVLSSLHGRAHGEKYVNEDATAEHPLGFAQVSVRTI